MVVYNAFDIIGIVSFLILIAVYILFSILQEKYDKETDDADS